MTAAARYHGKYSSKESAAMRTPIGIGAAERRSDQAFGGGPLSVRGNSS